MHAYIGTHTHYWQTSHTHTQPEKGDTKQATTHYTLYASILYAR